MTLRATSDADPLDPAEHGVAWLRAMAAGDFESAWRHTDLLEASRREGASVQAHHLVWDGRPFDGRRVLVRCWHGLGDTLQFMRFVPQLSARASLLHFLVQPMLLNLLRGAPGLGEVSNAWTDTPPPSDVEIEVMELAYALRCQAAAIPSPYPLHIRRPPHELLALRNDDGRPRVAVLWAASDWDRSRSVPLETLRPLLCDTRVRWFNFQQGPAANDQALANLQMEPMNGRTARIEDAAAAMRGMDLVLCVDGMPAHLAGTLGLPTWVMLKHEADWRWMRDRADTPWYPTLRLFRQRAQDDWCAVADDLAMALDQWLRARCR